ncbi:hypothetical protein IEC97_14635 [Neobacillus cucumis]|uniref:hypothetical protein n=1 Tax=Neobacillus cucumis TaxID=1740721 RepID=UPI0018DFACBD|nr:hypothetical protein [Neobacillus cucumis]MBI0578600.1 hypothetical protein [Neobacillus cucumis]
MPAYLNYVFTNTRQGSQTGKEVIISLPPGPAILLWTNSQSSPTLTGISVVSDLNGNYYNSPQGARALALVNQLHQLIANNTNLPFLKVEYDFPNDLLVINGVNYTVLNGGQFIGQQFNLAISSSPTKAVNNLQSVTDPFHIWSRNFFSGSQVQKLDLDMIVYNSKANNFSSIFEIKRSNKVSFNSWQPYTADKPNYEMIMNLADLLNIPFYTIHHDEVTQRVISPTKQVNVYTYSSGVTSNWNNFRSFSNRIQMTAQQSLNLL